MPKRCTKTRLPSERSLVEACLFWRVLGDAWSNLANGLLHPERCDDVIS
jgi:hypothetical protein